LPYVSMDVPRASAIDIASCKHRPNAVYPVHGGASGSRS
jgi:hypothetical protein